MNPGDGNRAARIGECETLVDLLGSMAQHSPDAKVVLPGHAVTQSHMRIAEDAARYAVALRERMHGGIGGVVGLLLPATQEFFPVFFGILTAGAAVSVLPVQAGVSAAAVDHLARMVRTARMRCVITDASSAPLGEALREANPELTVVGVTELNAAAATTAGPAAGPAAVPAAGHAGSNPEPPAHPGPESLAVVQFSSGSTSQPKGVMLSHRTVLAGLRVLCNELMYSPSDVLVSWNPLFHDMGLFAPLAALASGAEVHLVAPRAFIRDPQWFLRYLSQVGGTMVNGPNFSYDLLIAAAADGALGDCDLSRWRLAVNGAEPVRASTVEAFRKVFSEYGVPATAMRPAYGLAEATLLVSVAGPDGDPPVIWADRDALATAGRVKLLAEGDAGARPLVGAGWPAWDLALRLVRADGRVAGAGETGEIQLAGEAITTGYLNAPGATAELFQDGWLRTGDIGFRWRGQLYLSGRIREMVVIQGRNFFAEDVEEVVRQHDGIRGCVAFTAPETAGENVIVIAEATGSPDASALAERIRRRVAGELGLHAIQIHLVPRRWIPRTTSGKWQRSGARAKWLATVRDNRSHHL